MNLSRAINEASDKTMYQFPFALLFVAHVLFLCGCESIVEPSGLEEPSDSLWTFIVQTIDGKSVPDFAQNPIDYEWPLEIKLENYEAGHTLKGEVRLANLGWVKIDSNDAGVDKFLVDTAGRLGPVEFIAFSDIEISDVNMNGQFANAGPTIDTPAHDFTAEKQYIISAL